MACPGWSPDVTRTTISFYWFCLSLWRVSPSYPLSPVILSQVRGNCANFCQCNERICSSRQKLSIVFSTCMKNFLPFCICGGTTPGSTSSTITRRMRETTAQIATATLIKVLKEWSRMPGILKERTTLLENPRQKTLTCLGLIQVKQRSRKNTYTIKYPVHVQKSIMKTRDHHPQGSSVHFGTSSKSEFWSPEPETSGRIMSGLTVEGLLSRSMMLTSKYSFRSFHSLYV